YYHEFSTCKHEESEDSSLNFNSNSNADVTDKSTLLLELDSNAPVSDHTHADRISFTPSSTGPLNDTLSPQNDRNDSSLDFSGSTNEDIVKDEQQSYLTSFNNPSEDIILASPIKEDIHSPVKDETCEEAQSPINKRPDDLQLSVKQQQQQQQ
ncbi:unnamed protein product, partial [Rotaria socialis]